MFYKSIYNCFEVTLKVLKGKYNNLLRNAHISKSRKFHRFCTFVQIDNAKQ